MDRSLMDEEVLTSIIRCDETKTFAAVEPFHLSGLLSGISNLRHCLTTEIS
jgi:hypothetical protein